MMPFNLSKAMLLACTAVAILGSHPARAARDQESAPSQISISEYYRRPEVGAVMKKAAEKRSQIIATARRYFKEKDYENAIAAYKEARDFKMDLPDFPFPVQESRIPARESEEWADALDAAGRTDEAIEMYRTLVYQKRKLGQWKASYILAPISVLPEGVKDLEEARIRFPDYRVEVWATNEPILIARYTALLIKKQQYSEALAAYHRALDTYLPSEDNALIDTLKEIRKENFDQRRFRASAQVLLAMGLIGVDVHFGYYDVMGISHFQSAEIELNKAVSIKPDYAPSYFLLARIILQQRDELTQSRQQMAKAYLNKALQSARSEELRQAIRALR